MHQLTLSLINSHRLPIRCRGSHLRYAVRVLTKVMPVEQRWIKKCVQTAGNLVLRVAILYGFVESPSESAVTTLLSNVVTSDVTCAVDNVQRRFPTHCNDVAIVIRQLLDKHSQVWFYLSLFLGAV